MTDHRPVETWLTDMDGVLVHEEVALPGAAEFIEALKASGKSFLVLTNNSIFTPRDLRARLLGGGLDVPEEAIWTSALATAKFLAGQRTGGSAYVVGEAGLLTAMHGVGFVMTERDPDYVVLGRPGPTRSRRSPGPSASSRRAPASSPQTRTRADPARPGRCRRRARSPPSSRRPRAGSRTTWASRTRS
jgi:NagD protein